MDLAFSLPGRSRRRIAGPADLGALLARAAAVQAASATARVQAQLGQRIAAACSYDACVARTLSDRPSL